MSESSSTKPQALRGRRLLKWLREGVVLLLILYLVHLWQTRDALEGAAPPLHGQLLHGDSFSLDQRPAKPLLVYFWATWCPVCDLTSGHVESLSENYSVITVAMQSGEEEEIEQHLAEKGLNLPVLPDPQGEIAQRWGVRGVPTLYFLDPENRISYTSVGYTSPPGLRWRMWLNK
jgi:thiol-disulfide isomerase/thioredoxin